MKPTTTKLVLKKKEIFAGQGWVMAMLEQMME
jgi:hypothetical protein